MRSVACARRAGPRRTRLRALLDAAGGRVAQVLARDPAATRRSAATLGAAALDATSARRLRPRSSWPSRTTRSRRPRPSSRPRLPLPLRLPPLRRLRQRRPRAVCARRSRSRLAPSRCGRSRAPRTKTGAAPSSRSRASRGAVALAESDRGRRRRAAPSARRRGQAAVPRRGDARGRRRRRRRLARRPRLGGRRDPRRRGARGARRPRRRARRPPSARRPFAEAFTGAVARRDVGTVRAHVAALAADSRSLALYRALAEEILLRTEGAGREAEIRALLDAQDSPAVERTPARRNPFRVLQFAAAARHAPAEAEAAWFSSTTPRCRWRPRSCTTAPACAERPPTSTTSTAGRRPARAARWCRSRPRRTGRSSSTCCRSTSGVIGGFKTRVQLYTVPGQVFYNTTRKLVLKGVDGIVFVADSQRAMKDANVESLANLRTNLAEIGDQARRDPARLPVQQARPREHPLASRSSRRA